MAGDFKSILVGVDDSSDALAAFRYAIHRAGKDKSALIIVSVLEDSRMNVYEALSKDFVHGERDALEKHIREYCDLAERAGIEDVRAVVAEGNPGEEIVKKVISNFQADLLIIGASAKKGIAKHFGSQAAYMAKYAPISVLVIRE